MIESNMKFLCKCRSNHRQYVMQRYNKKFSTSYKQLCNNELLESNYNRNLSRKMFMKEVEFIKAVVNNKSNKLTSLNELLLNFKCHKVIKEDGSKYYILTNISKKCFDRGVYAVKLDKDQLSINVVNMVKQKLRQLDNINLHYTVDKRYSKLNGLG